MRRRRSLLLLGAACLLASCSAAPDETSANAANIANIASAINATNAANASGSATARAEACDLPIVLMAGEGVSPRQLQETWTNLDAAYRECCQTGAVSSAIFAGHRQAMLQPGAGVTEALFYMLEDQTPQQLVLQHNYEGGTVPTRDDLKAALACLGGEAEACSGD